MILSEKYTKYKYKYNVKGFIKSNLSNLSLFNYNKTNVTLLNLKAWNCQMFFAEAEVDKITETHSDILIAIVSMIVS